MGIDNSPLLNSYESEYLNVVFKDSLNGFDFHGKKIGFINSGENSKFLSLFLKEIPELQHIACEQLDQAIVTTEYVIDENRRIDKNNICNNGFN